MRQTKSASNGIHYATSRYVRNVSWQTQTTTAKQNKQTIAQVTATNEKKQFARNLCSVISGNSHGPITCFQREKYENHLFIQFVGAVVVAAKHRQPIPWKIWPDLCEPPVSKILCTCDIFRSSSSIFYFGIPHVNRNRKKKHFIDRLPHTYQTNSPQLYPWTNFESKQIQHFAHRLPIATS